jgi:TRAP-type mannitol/chloroaromatic compound transport system permease large subunit
MAHIYRGIVPFVILQLTTLVLCMIFPAIVTWWPKEAGFLD